MQGNTNASYGEVKYNPRGQWVSGNSYALNDWCYDNVGQYVCIAPIASSTTAPSSDTEHFKQTVVSLAQSGYSRQDVIRPSNWSLISKSVISGTEVVLDSVLGKPLGFIQKTDISTLTGWQIRLIKPDEATRITYTQGSTTYGITVESSTGALTLRLTENGTNTGIYITFESEYLQAIMYKGSAQLGTYWISVANTSVQVARAQIITGGSTASKTFDSVIEVDDDPNKNIRIGYASGYVIVLYRDSIPTETIPYTLITGFTNTDSRAVLVNKGINRLNVILNRHARVFGVSGMNQESPTLTRTDNAVGLTYTLGTDTVYSDFSECYPWSDIKEVTDDYGNKFIRIPKFYHKMTTNSDGTLKWQISGVKQDFDWGTYFTNGVNEVDYIDIGAYEGSVSNSRLCSVSGVAPTVSQAIATFRTNAMANGSAYHLYDFKCDMILKALYTIEFATTNCQSIAQGNVSSSAKSDCGATDTNTSKTGVVSGQALSASVAFKYRGIENPWGNIWKFVDGIGFVDEKIYLCLNHKNYANDTQASPYSYIGDRVMENGYAKTMGLLSENGYLYTSAIGGGSTTYYSDYYYQATGHRLLLVGGRWSNGAAAGLWRWNGDDAWSGSDTYTGCRLCKTPV